MQELLTLDDAERLAEAALPPDAWGYVAGGAGDERTLRWNREAFSRYRLRYRVLVDVSDVSTATTVLGTPVSMPVLVAPMAYQAIAHEDHELGMARGAAAAGTVAYIKGELNTTIDASVPAVAQATEAAIKNMKFFAISSKHDSVSGSFIARNAKDERIVITLSKTGDRMTKVQIRVGILGDEEVSRAILDEIKQSM